MGAFLPLWLPNTSMNPAAPSGQPKAAGQPTAAGQPAGDVLAHADTSDARSLADTSDDRSLADTGDTQHTQTTSHPVGEPAIVLPPLAHSYAGESSGS